jgi:hypothetical protein
MQQAAIYLNMSRLRWLTTSGMAKHIGLVAIVLLLKPTKIDKNLS